MNEIWKTIDGYPNYMVSNMGNVKNIKTGKMLKPTISTTGYLQIHLWKNNHEKNFKLHRLIALSFIPNPENKPCIDHINTNKMDNRVCNLRWVTHKENNNNPNTIEKHSGTKCCMYGKLGKNNNKSIPILQFTKNGELVKKWDSIMDIERELGIRQPHVSSCCKGKRKTTGGFIWRYYYKGIWLKKHVPIINKKVA